MLNLGKFWKKLFFTSDNFLGDWNQSENLSEIKPPLYLICLKGLHKEPAEKGNLLFLNTTYSEFWQCIFHATKPKDIQATRKINCLHKAKISGAIQLGSKTVLEKVPFICPKKDSAHPMRH